ncbi:replication protein RepA [Pseudonocardia acaciae]|uniref:replication protein RepA n=1 Tax=Pseudonocardia acaciae TaxID=551276 RepID=UPI00055D0B77|nr:replication protein RepA [Pseudonocardia acaciae]
MSGKGRPRRDELELVRAAAELWDQDEPELSYLARLWCQTSLPYRDPGDVPAWGRRNGALSLVVQPGMTIGPDGHPRSIGFPYGTLPRLLLTWLSTEAVRTREPVLVLGDSLSAFMRTLGLVPTGGRNGTITRLKKQMERLFLASLTVRWDGTGERQAGGRLNVASSYDLWWSEKNPDEPTLMPSTVRLSGEFFREVTEHPVPLDLGALRALRGSALRLDIYAFLCHRMSYLRRPTTIPWDALRGQFGSTLGENKNGRARFKQEFERNLREVLVVYRQAQVTSTRAGLELRPSPTHVPFKGLLAATKETHE